MPNGKHQAKTVTLVDASGRHPSTLKPFISGHFPTKNRLRLPKVKSRGHVYPLSYLPYF